MFNYDKALEYLKEAQKLDGLNHEIFERKGICYFNKVIKFFSKYLIIKIFRKILIWQKKNSNKHYILSQIVIFQKVF